MLKKLKLWINFWLKRPKKYKHDAYDDWYPDR